MPKRLPPQTTHPLNPPASAAFPYVFFEHVAEHPFQPGNPAFNLCNAWWLMDAAFLSYSNEATIRREYQKINGADVHFVAGKRSTQCYVASTDDWIVLAFRGTQVDDFWQSVLDWTIDARFVPVLDSHGDWVHAGFKSAIEQVWPDVSGRVRTLQATRRRPLWICGHSLGAALATIAANLCADDATLGFTGLYTFGSPRVGDRSFGREIRPANVFRFQNDSDLVTHVPLGLVFHHVGALQFIDGGGHLHANVDRARQLLLRAGALSASDAHSISGILQQNGHDLPLPGFLADHAPINYAILIWNCYEASLPASSESHA
ncbi:MAG TPA: lipase family protein [Vicinamibacterales bacterium]|nr:lipase family protein [Vicinamibacterales bacterium]